MTRYWFFVFGFVLFTLLPIKVHAAAERLVDESQLDYERSIKAVVRHKLFYKSGRIELAGLAGLMPYDSLMNHYTFGGRLSWHFSDHFGWEVLDAQLAFSEITGFTNSLVEGKTLSNLQTVKLKKMVTTGFLLSPSYGKVRFFGAQVVYLDFFLSLGLGFANTEVIKVRDTDVSVLGTPEVTSLKTSWDPVFHFGLGIKVFMNRAMGLIIDLRDHVVSSDLYGQRTLKSNFSVFGGLCFFIPTF